jgi:Rps23 Pro-64 3,4-dihydroxylase Tpa1-like proline 4-hydroxylase
MWIDFTRWDPAALAASWRAARPFPYVVIDDLVPEPRLQQLRAAVSREPHGPNVTDLYEMMASASTVSSPVLKEFQAALGAPDALAAISAICGKTLGRVEMRSYVYLAGSYLLPHSDCREEIGRLVAFAYYLLPRESSVGGELELFSVETEDGEIVRTAPAGTIEPRGNRVVLFEVSPTSLHQVREVTEGGRCSLSGWFYA